jgi:hypothetical protein
MTAIYSNGGNRWNILGFNFTKRDALSSVSNLTNQLVGFVIFTCAKILILYIVCFDVVFTFTR